MRQITITINSCSHCPNYIFSTGICAVTNKMVCNKVIMDWCPIYLEQNKGK